LSDGRAGFRSRDRQLDPELVDPPDKNRRGPSRGAGCGRRLTVTDDPSIAAPLEDHLAMLLKGVQACLQSMKHRGGAIGLLSLLDQLVNDLFLPSNTLLGDGNVSLGLGKVVLLKGVAHDGKP
jgi:hypothetical protein